MGHGRSVHLADQSETLFYSQLVPPIRKLHKPLILICQRAGRMKTIVTGN